MLSIETGKPIVLSNYSSCQIEIINIGYDSVQLFFMDSLLPTTESSDVYSLIIRSPDIHPPGNHTLYCYSIDIDGRRNEIKRLSIEIQELIPECYIDLNLKSNDSISISLFSLLDGIFIKLPQIAYCKVITYKIQVLRNDKIEFSELVVGSPFYSDAFRSYRKNLRNGDVIFLSQIEAECGTIIFKNIPPKVNYIKD